MPVIKPESTYGDLPANELRNHNRQSGSPHWDESTGPGMLLAIVAGPAAGRTFTVSPGESLRIGRSSRAGISIPEDTLLSGIHLAVECRDRMCRVIDLGGAGGTFLNGIRIQEARLREGDRVEAGQSALQVRLPATRQERPAEVKLAETTAGPVPLLSPTPVPCGEDSFPDLSPAEQKLLRLLGGGAGNLFALIDEDTNPSARHCLEKARNRFAPVWPDGGFSSGVKTGPVLVELSEGAPLLRTLVRYGWGRNWVVWLNAKEPFAPVFDHLADIASVQTRRGGRLRLRLGDPRLLRSFLPRLSAAECVAFFGPVTRFLMESEDSEALLEFQVGARGVVRGGTGLR